MSHDQSIKLQAYKECYELGLMLQQKKLPPGFSSVEEVAERIALLDNICMSDTEIQIISNHIHNLIQIREGGI